MTTAGSLKVTLTADRSMSLKPAPEALELRQVSLASSMLRSAYPWSDWSRFHEPLAREPVEK